MLINCIIETPQFMGSQDKFWMKKQSGIFDTVTLRFQPNDDPMNNSGSVGKHSVQFSSIADFESARIDKPDWEHFRRLQINTIWISVVSAIISITAIIILSCS